MSEALITPKVLSWARERRDVHVGDLAAKLDVRPDAISAWEAGERKPTFRQAKRLAQALYVPFGYLYLSEPPIEELPLPDFRTFPGQTPLEPSPDLLDLLNDVLGKQQWLREYRESQGEEELPFVGRYTSKDSEEEVANDIREVIDLNSARGRAPNWEGFMTELSRNADLSGIMVMRSGVVGNNNHRPLDYEEFRGFSVSDQVAPLAFVNGQDYKTAQIFTLAHELAHIWTGQGGISNPDYSLRSETQDGSLEQFCNRVAAETLVPSDDFRSRWLPDPTDLENNLQNLSRHYRVSSMVILRQAHDQDFIPIETYRESYSRLVERSGQATSAGETSSGNFHYTLTARNGVAFTTAVISSAAEGTLLSSEAADMLGIKVKTLPTIAEHLFGSPLTLA